MKLKSRTGLYDQGNVNITNDTDVPIEKVYEMFLVAQVEKMYDIDEATKHITKKRKKHRLYVDKETFYKLFPSIIIEGSIFIPYELFMYAYKRLRPEKEMQDYMDDIYHYIKANTDYPQYKVSSFLLLNNDTLSLCSL